MRSTEHREDAPTLLPFPVPTQEIEPDQAFEIEVPPSTEARKLVFHFYRPANATVAPAPGQSAIPLTTGAALLVGFRPAASSLLTAGL